MSQRVRRRDRRRAQGYPPERPFRLARTVPHKPTYTLTSATLTIGEVTIPISTTVVGS